MGGGLDGPVNSMRSFRAAIEANLEGIEFDVCAVASKVNLSNVSLLSCITK